MRPIEEPPRPRVSAEQLVEISLEDAPRRAMPGRIYGAVHGIDALPVTWLERLEDREAIERDARALETLSAT